MELAELRGRIETFPIDEPETRLTFAKRLANQNGWTPAYTKRVIREYKRFIVLAMTADHMVSPSEDVDQAWHLHLTYTVSYWERLRPLLPRPLHHHPSTGGKAQDDRFKGLYERTLETYESTFGEPAPADVWPPTERRFGHDLRWQRVNTAEHWILPKLTVRRGLGLGGATLLVGLAIGCAPTLAEVEPNAANSFALVVIFFLILIGIVSAAQATNREDQGKLRRRSGDGGYVGTDSGGASSESHGFFAGWLGSTDSGHHGGHDAGGGCGGGHDGGSGDAGGGCGGGGDSGGGCGGGGCGGGGD